MSMYFYPVGRSVKIPLLDPDNDIYMERVRLLAFFVSEAVEKWELFYDPSLTSSNLPKHLAYVLRKLAEMLPSDDIERIPEQNFYKKASILLDNSNENWAEQEKAEQALNILCAGFSGIQNRLDHGLKPFESRILPMVEIPQTAKKGFDSGKMISFLELKDEPSLLLAN